MCWFGIFLLNFYHIILIRLQLLSQCLNLCHQIGFLFIPNLLTFYGDFINVFISVLLKISGFLQHGFKLFILLLTNVKLSLHVIHSAFILLNWLDISMCSSILVLLFESNFIRFFKLGLEYLIIDVDMITLHLSLHFTSMFLNLLLIYDIMLLNNINWLLIFRYQSLF